MSRNLEDLHPYVKYLAEKFIQECKKQGIDVLIYSTFRSKEEQDKLYSQGRTASGEKVTNAKGGYSYHNYGLAFDCVPIINKKAQWNRTDLYDVMGKIGKSIGLEWGGDFKSIKDRPHFQWTGGLKIKDLLQGKRPISQLNLEFRHSINKLFEENIIDTPSYWIDNKEYKTEYVKKLIYNFSQYLGINKPENEFTNILNELRNKSVIDSPDYWINSEIYITEYVIELIIKFKKYIEKNNIDSEFISSVNKLAKANIINSPEYWINNMEYKEEYVKDLIKKVANKLG
ncbi:M15 family metallopeptidase [Tepidibacter hydrothermalis]|uniref:M15 family metallopeptidase n=1 Tax=Tepidibacter hydrothermalis TaxID=3036126 RepID=A0ABY8EHD1_9FIRM|nr:M15 family metallopeptidase [Tepidibacter hydrothermalis]WFD12166.1 M15 family metallopeptidase [Tepidibacter hydrothermalis]